MRGERRLLRLGEYLVGRACRQLPKPTQEEQYREWAAELPAILHDPQVRFAPRRAARMLGYAADTLRGAAMTPVRGRREGPHKIGGPNKIGLTALFCLVVYPLLPIVGLVNLALTIQSTVRAPGHGLNYVSLAWGLILVAWPIISLVRSTKRTGLLLATSSCLAGAVFFFWNAALAPGDWVNYIVAVWFLLAIPAMWLGERWVRTRRGVTSP